MARKKKKKSAPKRISAALTRFLKKQNPSKMKGVTRVRVKKLKGGGVTITPVKTNPYWPEGSSRTSGLKILKKWYAKGKRARTGGKYSSVGAAFDAARGKSYNVDSNARQYTSFERGWDS
jgi:hypothetical protein